MDTLLGVVIILTLGLAFLFYINKTVDQRYPKVKIDVRYRGTRSVRIFRLRGKLIVSDNIIGILMNSYITYGVIDSLRYYIQPNGQRIYDAVMRYDYLFCIEGHDMTEKEMKESRPVIKVPKTGKFNGESITLGEYMMCPLDIKYNNEYLTERSVKSGKEITTRLIEAEMASNEFIKSTNPVMAQLIASIPTAVLILSFGLVVYLSIQSMSDNIVKMLEIAKTIKEASGQ